MFGFFKEKILTSKQKKLKRRYPGVNIFFHKEMPIPSVNEILRLAPIVAEINGLAEKIKPLSDAELKAKTDMFKEHIANQDQVYNTRIQELQARFSEAATPKEKEKIK